MNIQKIILGSGSPRRRELLQSIWNGTIEIVKSEKPEDYPIDLPTHQVPEYLSRQKANDLAHYLQDEHEILVTADTIVLLDDNILGKPTSTEDAKRMLQSLSGKVHQVITGVTIRSLNHEVCFSEMTHVHFLILNDSDIEYYVHQYNPLDKAGAYGIQEYIGMIGIARIEGCYYNVMGLPTSRLHQRIASF